MYILDSDHLSVLQFQDGDEFKRLSGRISEHQNADFFVTIISFHEQVNGWSSYINKSRDSSAVVRAYQKFELLISNFSAAQVLPFSSDAAEVFNELRAQRIRVGTMDLRIASIAIANQMTLLTRNSVDFSRIPDLAIQDWLSISIGE